LSQADQPEVAVGQVLIEDEKMEIAGVKWSVYSYYGKSVGEAWTCTCLFMFLLYQAFQLGGNIWLSGTWGEIQPKFKPCCLRI
jgi:hypothetical protein